MNLVERTIAAEMARPMPVRMCARGCGMPAHHGGCKGEERFAMADGIRRCAQCPNKLAGSNPGPLCRRCQSKALHEGIAARERLAVGAERGAAARPKGETPRGYVPGPRQAVAEIPGPKPKPAAAPAAVCTIRIADIPVSAESRSETSELFARMLALERGEALVIVCESRRHTYKMCERLRKRLTKAQAGKLRWKRDGLTLYAWLEPWERAGASSLQRKVSR